MPLEIRGQLWKAEPKPVGSESTPVDSFPLAAVPRRQGFGFGANRRGQIAHWTVPPPFADRRRALMELGVERYKDAIRDYYAAIGQYGVEAAQHTHARWVMRRCISYFETQMRKFQRNWERRMYKNKEGIWLEETNRAESHGQLISPEEMYESSRMLADIELTLKTFQVREDLRPWVTQELKRKLRMLWELKGVSK